jgi:hypothetical protein
VRQVVVRESVVSGVDRSSSCSWRACRSSHRVGPCDEYVETAPRAHGERKLAPYSLSVSGGHRGDAANGSVI